MKKLYSLLVLTLVAFMLKSQCLYVPSTATSSTDLSYVFVGGAFQSYGCAPIDPTRWLSGNGISITVNFVTPQECPTFRVWGMNDDDVATVTVNSVAYPLNSSTAWYDPKVVCGLSPGPDGVFFAGGNLVGSNTNAQGNYSYSDVHLTATNVTTMTITGIAGAGWGFAGALVHCPCLTGLNASEIGITEMTLFPNPFSISTTIQFNTALVNGTLTLFNSLGQVIQCNESINGDHFILNRNELASGLYFISLSEGNTVLKSGKILLIE